MTAGPCPSTPRLPFSAGGDFRVGGSLTDVPRAEPAPNQCGLPNFPPTLAACGVCLPPVPSPSPSPLGLTRGWGGTGPTTSAGRTKGTRTGRSRASRPLFSSASTHSEARPPALFFGSGSHRSRVTLRGEKGPRGGLPVRGPRSLEDLGKTAGEAAALGRGLAAAEHQGRQPLGSGPRSPPVLLIPSFQREGLERERGVTVELPAERCRYSGGTDSTRGSHPGFSLPQCLFLRVADPPDTFKGPSLCSSFLSPSTHQDQDFLTTPPEKMGFLLCPSIFTGEPKSRNHLLRL